jgi:hypothetical protein
MTNDAVPAELKKPVQWTADPSAFPELAVHNALLDDRKALEAEWERRGYWYFKGVLDREALKTFRGHVLDALRPLDVVEEDGDALRISDRAPASFPEGIQAGMAPFPQLVHFKYWREFLSDTRIAAVFQRLIGAKPDWVPVAELRAVPPNDPTGQPFGYPHQDGFYNEGYRCLTAWMPLWAAPRPCGGLALAEGLHRRGYFHDTSAPPRYPIPPNAIPAEAWRTSNYEAGDVVIFDRMLPHSGVRNRSREFFRASFDVRCVLPGDPPPVVGFIVSADAEQVTVRADDGSIQRFRFDDQSCCRGVGAGSGFRIPLADVAAQYAAGQEIMLTHEGGVVRLLREPKY